MNVNKLILKRKERKVSVQEMADALHVTRQAYYYKESGKRKSASFSDEDKIIVANILSMTFDEFNDIFYDGKLPFEPKKTKEVVIRVIGNGNVQIEGNDE